MVGYMCIGRRMKRLRPLGQLPFFIDYLKQAGLFTAFVADSPLRYVSPNAPKIRDILGTMVLSIVTGARRYAHINALRHDALPPFKKVRNDLTL